MVVLDNPTAANTELWFVDFFLFQKWVLLSLLANYPWEKFSSAHTATLYNNCYN